MQTNESSEPVDTRPRVYLVMPFIDKAEPEAMAAANRATAGKYLVDGRFSRGSALCRGINTPWSTMCNSQPAYDYFAILHSDAEPEGHWLDIEIGEMEKHGFDAIHAFSAIKDSFGLTSTAYGRLDDPWAPVRRITTTEIEQLPETFGIADLERVLGRFGFGESDLCMLCNTATIVIKVNKRTIEGPGPFAINRRTKRELRDWPRCFPGFTVFDRIVEDDPEFMVAESVSEDWWFGRWAAQNGLKVGCTSKVRINHYGRAAYSTDHAWGIHKRDEAFFMRAAIEHDLAHRDATRVHAPLPSRGK